VTIDDLLREIQAAHLQNREVVRIRLTAQAIPGTATTVPIAQDPRAALPDASELVVHPENWTSALAALDPDAGEDLEKQREPYTCWGVPVIKEFAEGEG
jgi:hypothetical protein